MSGEPVAVIVDAEKFKAFQRKESKQSKERQLAFQRRMNEEVLKPLTTIIIAKHWEELNVLMLEHQSKQMTEEEIRERLKEIVG